MKIIEQLNKLPIKSGEYLVLPNLKTPYFILPLHSRCVFNETISIEFLTRLFYIGGLNLPLDSMNHTNFDILKTLISSKDAIADPFKHTSLISSKY